MEHTQVNELMQIHQLHTIIQGKSELGYLHVPPTTNRIYINIYTYNETTRTLDLILKQNINKNKKNNRVNGLIYFFL